MSKIPSISGNQLIKLLKKDGWIEGKKAKHGLPLKKKYIKRTRVTIIPTKNDDLPNGTLSAILGPQQTKIGRKGFEELINKYGI